MNQNIEIIHRDAQPVLLVFTETSVFKIPKVLAECFVAVTDQMKSTGASKGGAPFAEYLDLDWESLCTGGVWSQLWQMLSRKMKMRAGIPVNREVSGSGDVEASEIPAGQYVKAIHTGPYQKLMKTYRIIAQWAAKEGVSLAARSFECYISDPGEVPGDQLETMILVPVEN